jgi:PAS domain S-box-containing protein
MHVDPLPPEVGGVIITHIDVTKRKLAEKQREESFRLFRALIEYSSEMITMTSRTGEVLYQSPSVARLMGYSESELAGRNSFEMVHPDDLAGLIAQQKTLVARPDLVHRNEFRFRHKDGTWHYMETSAQNLLEESGINGIIVNGHDITERKKVELALRESQERLNFALSAAGVGIWEYEVQSGRVSLSEQVEAMLGMEPTSFDGTFETFVNMTLPYHRERLILRVQEALERGGDYHIEYQVKRTDGKVVWLEGQGQAYLDEAGKPLKLSGVVQDITRRKETEAALLVSETRFTAFMEHSPAAAFILDDQANILYVNKAYRHIFETQEELIGRNCATLFPAELNERHRTHDREVLEKQVVVLETESWQKQDGRPGHFLGYKFPITEASGRKLVGGVGIDISEQKAAQEALARSEAQLRQSQKMEAVGQLAGGVAHDFNNLLTAITGYSELVLMQLSEAEPLYADVKEILGAANRATSLTRQLLAFSRQQVLKPAVLDLNQVVGEMERMLRRLIGENIELITRPGERLAAVRADQGQLEQVIVNLAVNARDAMPEVGKLIFETASIELDQEYKAYHPYIAPGSYVRLAVSDTGCGMNETIRNRIFEPFFTTKERGRGTGLGLSTVYGIIKQSGGYIEVYSEEGLGTTFKIYLPAVTSSQEAYIPAQVPVYGAGTAKLQDRQATVLVVEDEEGVRNLGARVLEQSGYRVLVAGSGVEALSIAKQNNGRIDLLLTDVVMPKLSGPALSKLLAQSQPGIKILYMSGYTDGLLAENEEVLTGKVVSEQLIQKPFTPQSLLQKVRQTLEDCFNSATDGYD